MPSPAFVGVIAVTQTSFPSAVPASRSSTARSIFAFVRPYGSTSSGSRPASAAISSIGRRVAACAISRLDGSAVVIGRTLMPCDGAEVALERARLDDLADLRDHVPKLVVGGVVVRPDPDARARAEVAEDLALRELLVDGRELVDVDGDGAAAPLRVARARDPEAGRVGEGDQQVGLPERIARGSARRRSLRSGRNRPWPRRAPERSGCR